MALPTVVKDYLDAQRLPYRLLAYPVKGTLQQITEFANIATHRLIRSVMLQDTRGCLLAILPSSHILDFASLYQLLQRDLEPLYGDEMDTLFKGCQPGSRPPLPAAFGLPALVEASIGDLEGDVYFDAGSRDLLVGMRCQDFMALLKDIQSASFSRPLTELDMLQHQASTAGELVEITGPYVPSLFTQTFKELPDLTGIVRQNLALRTQPGIQASGLANLLADYPTLAAACVHWARAQRAGDASQTVQSVLDAIAVLGVDIAANLALAAAIARNFRIPPDGPLGGKAFWHHAVYCAALAVTLARVLPTALHLQPGLVHLVGLLHRFGYLVLSHLFPARFFLLNHVLAEHRHIPVEQVENSLLGTDNRLIGGWLLEEWGMPPVFSNAIRQHDHEDYSQPYSEYPNLVLIANRLLVGTGISEAGESRLPTGILYSLGLTEEEARAALARVQRNGAVLDDLAVALSS
jgi:HD-like signal output (HDOD) protein/prolyl-tRNA editing enzyme YbaK/EbsC (Cys-tRNA(Pro) deacylase)